MGLCPGNLPTNVQEAWVGAWRAEVVRLVPLGTREGQHWKGQVLSSLPQGDWPVLAVEQRFRGWVGE